jgi:hypothetical protein
MKLLRLMEHGQCYWLDDLIRRMIAAGNLQGADRRRHPRDTCDLGAVYDPAKEGVGACLLRQR